MMAWKEVTMMEKEIRQLNVDELRVKQEDDKPTIFEGYVSKFNERSQFMGFYETVHRDAFNSSLESGNNIFALYNHDADKILGSTRNESLKLSTDETGLRFQLQPNLNISYAKDVAELIRSGEIRGCSFGFRVNKDEWTIKDGHDYRTLLDVDLMEITVTPMPAYESSEVSCRSYEQFKEKQKQQEQRNKDLELLKLQMDLLKSTYDK